MSFCCGVEKTAGLHLASCHWFVHAYVYSRFGLVVAVRVPTLLSDRMSHFSVLRAATPTEVCDGVPVVSVSQAAPEPATLTARSQPGAWTRHHFTRVSVLE